MMNSTQTFNDLRQTFQESKQQFCSNIKNLLSLSIETTEEYEKIMLLLKQEQDEMNKFMGQEIETLFSKRLLICRHSQSEIEHTLTIYFNKNTTQQTILSGTPSIAIADVELNNENSTFHTDVDHNFYECLCPETDNNQTIDIHTNENQAKDHHNVIDNNVINMTTYQEDESIAYSSQQDIEYDQEEILDGNNSTSSSLYSVEESTATNNNNPHVFTPIKLPERSNSLIIEEDILITFEKTPTRSKRKSPISNELPYASFAEISISNKKVKLDNNNAEVEVEIYNTSVVSGNSPFCYSPAVLSTYDRTLLIHDKNTNINDINDSNDINDVDTNNDEDNSKQLENDYLNLLLSKWNGNDQEHSYFLILKYFFETKHIDPLDYFNQMGISDENDNHMYLINYLMDMIYLPYGPFFILRKHLSNPELKDNCYYYSYEFDLEDCMLLYEDNKKTSKNLLNKFAITYCYYLIEFLNNSNKIGISEITRKLETVLVLNRKYKNSIVLTDKSKVCFREKIVPYLFQEIDENELIPIDQILAVNKDISHRNRNLSEGVEIEPEDNNNHDNFTFRNAYKSIGNYPLFRTTKSKHQDLILSYEGEYTKETFDDINKYIIEEEFPMDIWGNQIHRSSEHQSSSNIFPAFKSDVKEYYYYSHPDEDEEEYEEEEDSDNEKNKTQLLNQTSNHKKEKYSHKNEFDNIIKNHIKILWTKTWKIDHRNSSGSKINTSYFKIFDVIFANIGYKSPLEYLNTIIPKDTLDPDDYYHLLVTFLYELIRIPLGPLFLIKIVHTNQSNSGNFILCYYQYQKRHIYKTIDINNFGNRNSIDSMSNLCLIYSYYFLKYLKQRYAQQLNTPPFLKYKHFINCFYEDRDEDIPRFKGEINLLIYNLLEKIENGISTNEIHEIN